MNINATMSYIYDLSPEEIRVKVETHGTPYMVIMLGYDITIFLSGEKTAKDIANELVRKLLMAIRQWEDIEQPEQIGSLPF